MAGPGTPGTGPVPVASDVNIYLYSSGKCQPRNSRLPNLVATGFGNFLCMFVLKKHCSARFLITSRHSASRAHFADVLIAHPLPTRFFSDRKKNVSQCTGVKQWIGSGFTALFLPPNFPNPCRRFSTVPLHPHRGPPRLKVILREQVGRPVRIGKAHRVTRTCRRRLRHRFDDRRQ